MKKETKGIVIMLSILSLLTLHSIAYSVLSTTMNISGSAFARVATDVRLTDYEIFETSTNAISSYEEFNKDTIKSNITLPNADSYIIYKIKITNYGSNSIGIKSLENIPENLTYELIDYNLLDEICDKDNKCNLGAVKELYIKIKYNIYNEENITYDINIKFNFTEICKINYIYISDNNYQKTIEKDTNLNLDLTNSNINFIKVTNENTQPEYSYINNVLQVSNVTEDITITGSDVLNLEYTGTSQKFVLPFTGTYKLELWGAQGGSYEEWYGGYGAYVTGEIKLTAGENLYAYVGGVGTYTNVHAAIIDGGFNGGGQASLKWSSGKSYNEKKSSGGGATHISTIDSTIAQNEDLSTIYAIAAGGSGEMWFAASTYHSYCNGGSGGGIEGTIGTCDSTMIDETRDYYILPNQTTAGYSDYAGNTSTGYYGQGGNGYSGGGVGLYGGAGGYIYSSGGSSYIANPLLINKYMLCYECTTSEEESTKTLSVSTHSEEATSDVPKEGNGAIRISLISKD